MFSFASLKHVVKLFSNEWMQTSQTFQLKACSSLSPGTDQFLVCFPLFSTISAIITTAFILALSPHPPPLSKLHSCCISLMCPKLCCSFFARCGLVHWNIFIDLLVEMFLIQLKLEILPVVCNLNNYNKTHKSQKLQVILVLMTVIGTRNSIVKWHSYKLKNHMTTLLSEGRFSSPCCHC